MTDSRPLKYQSLLLEGPVAKLKVKLKSLSHVRLFSTPWTVAYQAPPSMGFSRQEYWSGLPFPSPGDLPDSGIIHGSPALQADSLPSEPPGKPWHILQRIGFGCKTVPNLFFRKQSMMTQQIIGMKRFILF